MKELLNIQSKLKAPKGQFNSFGKYKYRSCEDILESVKPLLAEEKCALTISDDIVMVGERIYVKAHVILVNEKGEQVETTAFAREEETKKGMDGSQVTGAASSYARKYALNGLFCIDDNKDSDATNKGDSKKDDGIDLALQQVKEAKSRKELNDIWNNWNGLQSDKVFSSAVSEASKKYPKNA